MNDIGITVPQLLGWAATLIQGVVLLVVSAATKAIFRIRDDVGSMAKEIAELKTWQRAHEGQCNERNARNMHEHDEMRMELRAIRDRGH